MIRNHLHMIHSISAAPALLREGKIHAECVNAQLRHLQRFFVEALRLRVAHRCIKRWHDAEYADSMPRTCQIRRLEPVVDGLEIRRFFAGFQFRTNYSEWISSESCCSMSFDRRLHIRLF